MKKTLTILFPAVLFLFSFSMMSNTEANRAQGYTYNPASAQVEFPAEINKILEKSCNACHTKASKSKKGKMKLVFDNFSNGKYSTGKQIAKLNGIVKALEKGKMPTKKFVEKYPDRALTDAESKALIAWAKGQAQKLAAAAE